MDGSMKDTEEECSLSSAQIFSDKARLKIVAAVNLKYSSF